MGAQHTPGPWSYKAEGGRFIIDNWPRRAIACTAGFEPKNEANARLNAAAPDLLDALEHIIGCAHEAPKFGPFDQIDNTGEPYQSADFESALNKGRTAIRTARGEA